MRKIFIVLMLGSLLFRHYFWFQAFLYSWLLLASYLQMQQEKRFFLNELLRLNLLLSLLTMATGFIDYLLITRGLPWFITGNTGPAHRVLTAMTCLMVVWSLLVLGSSLIRRKPAP